jgi:hypothetical protein
MAAGADPSGSRLHLRWTRSAFVRRELQESRRIPAAFSIFTASAEGRENPAGLLDITISLC